MSKVDLDYSEFDELGKVFTVMTDELQSQIKSCARIIGNQLKSNTEQSIPREPIAKHGIHLADDVKMSVSSGKEKTTITVKGGSNSGKLWWPVDAGHFTKNNKFVPGVHFTDKAYSMTNVEGPVDEMLQQVVNKNE